VLESITKALVIGRRQIHNDSSSYVDEKIAEAIRAKDGNSRFKVTTLLGLLDELNDNYARKNTYASHTLLRAILNHAPNILGYANFTAVANSYSWGRSDKGYLKNLADFRDQADDALRRQISTRTNLLIFDDMPTLFYVDRLPQECSERL
jgi:hypothetical protein